MIHGFLVIDKPSGMTSHDVVQRVRRWAKQRRVGHLGTLDPLATGVLPIALGEATKLSQLLTHGEKSYRGRVRLGIDTTTYDREGEVLRECEGPWPSEEDLRKALETFIGEIQQTPPPYSAIKTGGQAAYRRVRRGEQVTLEPRTVTISRLELLDYEPPFASIDVDCSAGTYLRALANDLGKLVKVGGHLWELVRTRSGPFRIEQSLPLDELDESGHTRLISLAEATGLPSFEADARVSRRVRNGIQLGRHEVKGAPPEGNLQLVRAGKLIALLQAQRGIPELRTLRVFLEDGE
ncbi:MAG: tRNA pseudouridine(55) synthase TruB [bacterium]|nr:tRNA pseudouridine(55) synthase TruB [bacterium]